MEVYRVVEDRATRERLLTAAEALIAERGSAATSVRDVLTAAGVANASAVGYYFGSKDGLVAAVERRAVERVNDERSAAFEALGEAPELAELVRAWLAPLVRLRCAGRGPATVRVFMRIFDEPEERWEANGAREVAAVGDRFFAASAVHLEAEGPDLFWRWQSVNAVSAFYCHGLLDRGHSSGVGPDDVEVHLGRLVPQCVALLTAGQVSKQPGS